MASGPTGADAATAQATNVKSAAQATDDAEDAAWGNVGEALFDTKPLKEQVSQMQADTTANLPSSARKLPSAEINDILNLPDTVPLRTLQDIRSSLGSTANAAGQAGDMQAAALAGRTRGVGGLLEAHINNPDNLIVQTPDALTNYNAARAATKAKYDAFGDDNKAGAQIPDVVAGRVAPESTLARFLPPGAEGSGVQSLSRLKMSVGTGSGLAPARSYLVGKLQDAIPSGTDAFNRVLRDYGYAFNDNDMFTPAQQQVFRDASDAVTQINRKAAPGTVAGSPTLKGLQGPSFARTLYGNMLGRVAPVLSKAVGAAAGTALAKVAPVLGNEEIAGTLFGGEYGSDLFKNASSSARGNVIRTLRQASHDPALARELAMKSSAANLKLAPRVRSLLNSLGVMQAMALPGSAGADPASGDSQ
jgi:hypothetical protein